MLLFVRNMLDNICVELVFAPSKLYCNFPQSVLLAVAIVKVVLKLLNTIAFKGIVYEKGVQLIIVELAHGSTKVIARILDC